MAIAASRHEGQVGTRLAVPVRTLTTNQVALQQMCEQGMGIARLLHADAWPALERGTLVRVLPQLLFPARPVTLLTPGRGEEPAKVRVALSALKRYSARLDSALMPA